MTNLQEADQEIFSSLAGELKRQREGIEMIPSENYVSENVLRVLGSVFTNKYSEGYPGKRYYGGQDFTDAVEDLAIARAKQIFGAEYVNVQPLSGAPANMAVYYASLEIGDKVMGMKLDHGGHLTHGMKLNFSGRYYDFIPYGVNKQTEVLDMDEVREIALREKPKMIVVGLSAYPRELDWQAFKDIADEVGALTFADIAHTAGLIAAGEQKNPVPFFDFVSTTTHKTLRGPRGGMIMAKEKYAKDLARAVFPGLQGGPHMNNIAAKAVAFKEVLQPEFKVYAKQVIANMKAMAEVFKKGGLRLISGGTDNHLVLADVTDFNLTGKEAQIVLDEVGISLNKNTIPFETRSAMDPSGIRLGTACATTRGMKEKDVEILAQIIMDVLRNPKDSSVLEKSKKTVKDLCENFPLYPDRVIE
jgi:glycine hydroxymethyltransferase